MPYTVGSETKTTFLKLENHKLMHEFEVEDSVEVFPGQPVFISGDGQVSPILTSTGAINIIGIAMQGGVAGELVTVMMTKASAIIFMECETDSLAVGPVRTGTTNVYNGTTGYNLIDDASVVEANHIGWAIEGGDDGDVVRVAVK